MTSWIAPRHRLDMNLWQLGTMAFVIGLSGAMSPGPVLAATIASSACRGFSAGPWIVAGHAALELALITILLAGASRWLTIAPVQRVLTIVGGLVLMITGGWSWRAALREPSASILPTTQPAPTPRSPYGERHPAVWGCWLSLSNPYWILWWATVGLALLPPVREHGWIPVAVFFTGHILADLVWYSLVAAVVVTGRSWLTPRSLRGIVLACHAAVATFGAFWAVRAAWPFVFG